MYQNIREKNCATIEATLVSYATDTKYTPEFLNFYVKTNKFFNILVNIQGLGKKKKYYLNPYR